MILYKLKNVLNELPYSRFYELRIIDKIVDQLMRLKSFINS